MKVSFPARLACAAAAALLGCGRAKCVLPDAGSCSVDSDCVLAYCADEPCPGCGRGTAIATSQLAENACLLPVTTAVPAECSAGVPACALFCPALPQVVASCISGTCSTVVLDGG
ncbi:MAG TPA: hypothetical protein VMB50_23355 [Myxococcales bacterium]|nr:hypothetical protein [Myxococcales bacterium]